MDQSPMHQLQVPLLAEENRSSTLEVNRGSIADAESPPLVVDKSVPIDINPQPAPVETGKSGTAITSFERQLSAAVQIVGYIDVIGGVLAIVLFSYVLSVADPGQILGSTLKWGSTVTLCSILIVLSCANGIMGAVGVYSSARTGYNYAVAYSAWSFIKIILALLGAIFLSLWCLIIVVVEIFFTYCVVSFTLALSLGNFGAYPAAVQTVLH